MDSYCQKFVVLITCEKRTVQSERELTQKILKNEKNFREYEEMKFVMQQNNERMLKVSPFNHLILVFLRT